MADNRRRGRGRGARAAIGRGARAMAPGAGRGAGGVPGGSDDGGGDALSRSVSLLRSKGLGEEDEWEDASSMPTMSRKALVPVLDDELDDDFIAKKGKNKVKVFNQTICDICHVSGRLIQCDDECGRWFHLGCAQLDGIPPADQPFRCVDCTAKQHNCFQCNKRASTEDPSFKRCAVANCGRFYHLLCVRNNPRTRFFPNSTEAFRCPLHYCKLCTDEGELKSIVQCQTCPTAMHQKCIRSSMAASITRLTRRGIFCDSCTARERETINGQTAIESAKKTLQLPPVRARLKLKKEKKKGKRGAAGKTPGKAGDAGNLAFTLAGIPGYSRLRYQKAAYTLRFKFEAAPVYQTTEKVKIKFAPSHEPAQRKPKPPAEAPPLSSLLSAAAAAAAAASDTKTPSAPKASPLLGGDDSDAELVLSDGGSDEDSVSADSPDSSDAESEQRVPGANTITLLRAATPRMPTPTLVHGSSGAATGVLVRAPTPTLVHGAIARAPTPTLVHGVTPRISTPTLVHGAASTAKRKREDDPSTPGLPPAPTPTAASASASASGSAPSAAAADGSATPMAGAPAAKRLKLVLNGKAEAGVVLPSGAAWVGSAATPEQRRAAVLKRRADRAARNAERAQRRTEKAAARQQQKKAAAAAAATPKPVAATPKAPAKPASAADVVLTPELVESLLIEFGFAYRKVPDDDVVDPAAPAPADGNGAGELVAINWCRYCGSRATSIWQKGPLSWGNVRALCATHHALYVKKKIDLSGYSSVPTEPIERETLTELKYLRFLLRQKELVAKALVAHEAKVQAKAKADAAAAAAKAKKAAAKPAATATGSGSGAGAGAADKAKAKPKPKPKSAAAATPTAGGKRPTAPPGAMAAASSLAEAAARAAAAAAAAPDGDADAMEDDATAQGGEADGAEVEAEDADGEAGDGEEDDADVGGDEDDDDLDLDDFDDDDDDDDGEFGSASPLTLRPAGSNVAIRLTLGPSASATPAVVKPFTLSLRPPGAAGRMPSPAIGNPARQSSPALLNPAMASPAMQKPAE